ncbi:MAG: hypothetical protein KDK33_13235, partial [Leptospiraceae bacterium]|nr:hypothetical protein [Leptospiraceae bacterium]
MSQSSAELFPDPSMKLFEDFSSLDRKTWEERILKDLKNPEDPKSALNRLKWNTEGMVIEPFYLSDEIPQGLEKQLPGSFPYLRGIQANGNAWLTEQTVDLRFVDPDALDALLQEFQDHELGSVRLIAGEKQLGLAKEMLQKIKGPCFLDIRGPLKPWTDILGSAGSNVRPGCDPLGDLAENGYSVEGASSLAADLDSAAEIIKKNSVAVFCVRGDRFICAGADHPTSIALILSSAAYYVSELLGRGLSLEQSLGAIHVRHGISSSFFPEIATLRATRHLWSQIAAFFAGKPMDGADEPWKKAAALYQS